ncbi:t-SNARE [Gonapodya prolifera JEL478]|uniref:t-SNARE n=1 Tax=Gonapodya prolifera (strain JEL478) TaxID=1344416 RepID=A0A139AXW1_GONPJ|nr:t-SNARE [Gonapodya prolifera JEL478]|eukprot:KXS21578.1 t-SNARE [Gonapodya prolifera JEL478]
MYSPALRGSPTPSRASTPSARAASPFAVPQSADPQPRPSYHAFKDRTNEFFTTVESIASRSSNGPMETHALLRTSRNDSNGKQQLSGGPPNSQSAFTREAASVGKEINLTMEKLSRLAKLAKRRTLFDDRPEEINQLVFLIKQDIARVSGRISSLQQSLNEAKRRGPSQSSRSPASTSTPVPLAANRHAADHASSVLFSLQSRLASTSSEFKDVLEVRTRNLREQKQRRDQYGFAGAPTDGTAGGGPAAPGSGTLGGIAPPAPSPSPFPSVASAIPPSSDSPLYRSSPLAESGLLHRHSSASARASPIPNGGSPTPRDSSDHVIDMGSSGANAPYTSTAYAQQQLLAPASNAYLDSRRDAIDSIESTIAELGQLYQQFVQVLAGQRDQVRRIDEDVAAAEINVDRAGAEIARYYQNLRGNRMLMVQAFLVVMVFVLLFVLLM